MENLESESNQKADNAVEAKREAITLEELQSLHQSFTAKEEEICDRYETLLDFVEENEKCPEIIKEINEQAQAFLDETLNSKDRFSKVFRTELGSYYFVIDSGEGFRVKWNPLKSGKGGFFQIQPIMKTTFFLPQAEADRILKDKRLELHIGKPIQTTEYEKGAVPLELNKHESEANSEYTLTGKTLVISEPTPSKYKAPACHIGNAVSEILK